MKTAIIVVDMLKDNIDTDSHFNIGEEGRKIVPRLKQLLSIARNRDMPIVFANDTFYEDDFIFRGKMKPHALQGTIGAEVIDELEPQKTDIILEKRKFSAFFQTGLDLILGKLGVDTIVVAGISTLACVLMTALDGICYNFRVIILEDCSAAHKEESHLALLGLYRNFPIYPLLRIMKLKQFLSEITVD